MGIQVRGTASAARVPVLVTGGVHAREWAPPDALLSFVKRLVRAHAAGADIVYPAFTSGGVTYSDPNYRVTALEVAAILDRINLFVVPVVNPDGRDFSVLGQSGTPTPTEMTWRKNRRAISSSCTGVDINRNFPIAWDHEEYYRPDAARKVDISVDPCHEIFKGPSAASEAETRNMIDLVNAHRFEVSLDIHTTGRQILIPWGIEFNQSDDPDQSFTNVDKHHIPPLSLTGRDGKIGDDYSEFVTPGLPGRLSDLADAMSLEIMASAGSDFTAQTRSSYGIRPAVDVYPDVTVVGSLPDWVFSRQFRDPTWPQTSSFTVEAGFAGGGPDPGDDDGGHWPNFATQFPKVEREIHAAVFGLLKAL